MPNAMRYCDIPGHNDIKDRLRKMVDGGRLPHALLIEGPVGTAKFALARATAQYIHCQNRQNGDSCGTCPSCRQHAAVQHIDTLYSFPVTKINGKQAISDDWRPEFVELMTESPWMDMDVWLNKLKNPASLPSIYVQEGAELSRRLSYTAHVSKYKIVLMWLPERMEVETANKLLKLIEEPFSDTLFIMTSDNPRLLLPTIYSRVQRVTVKRYDNETIAAYLAHNGVEPDVAAAAAAVAEGNLIQAKKVAGQDANGAVHLERFIKLMRLAYQKDIAALKAWAENIGTDKREPLIQFLKYCVHMIRENFIFNFHNPALNIVTAQEAAFAANFARFVNERNVLSFIKTFDNAINDIANNANAKIVLFDLAITIVMILRR